VFGSSLRRTPKARTPSYQQLSQSPRPHRSGFRHWRVWPDIGQNPVRFGCDGKNGCKETHPQFSQYPDGISSTVLYEGPWDDLESIGNCSEGRTSDSLQSLTLLSKSDTDGHLSRTSTRSERWVENDVPGDRHGIGKVPVDLVQDILGRSSEQDGACLGGLAFRQEGEVSSMANETSIRTTTMEYP
jgi:hypothetical protein